MEISPPAIIIIQEEETFKAKAYDDARPDYDLKPGDKIIGTLTIGYGHTNAARNDDELIKIGDTVTEEEAKEILLKDLEQYVDIVNKRMKTFDVELSQPQFDGMVFATMNRPKKMSRGGLWRAIASGDEDKIKAEWNKTIADSIKQFPGLADREVKELDMFLAEEVQEVTTPVDMDNAPDRGIPVPPGPNQVEGFNPSHIPEPKQDNSKVNLIWTKLYEDLSNSFIDNPRTRREQELFKRNPIYSSQTQQDKTENVVYDSEEKQKIHDNYARMLQALSESLMR